MDFEPTSEYLTDWLVRSGAAPRADAESLVGQAQAMRGVIRDVNAFLAVCEDLKGRGGLVEFVATMAASAGRLHRAAAIMGPEKPRGTTGSQR